MSDRFKALASMITGAVVVIGILILISWGVLAGSDKEAENLKANSIYLAGILGKPFTLNGKTYIGVNYSSWSGTIRCVSRDAPEQWIDPAAIEGLMKLPVEKP